MNINIQNIILEHISTDDSFTSNNQAKVLSIYSKLTSTEKNSIDSLFIELCGYSLDTIIKETNSFNLSGQNPVETKELRL